MCAEAAPNVTRIRRTTVEPATYRTALILHRYPALDNEFAAVDLAAISGRGLAILGELLRERVAPVGGPTIIDVTPEED
jgi:hypothetical protein